MTSAIGLEPARHAAASDAQWQPGTQALPVIDLQALSDPATRPQALRQLARTARDTGFFYLEGHGIDAAQWQGIQRQARAFFALPLADKQALAIANTRHFRGYTAVGMEITRQRPDQREQNKRIFLLGMAVERRGRAAPWRVALLGSCPSAPVRPSGVGRRQGPAVAAF